MTQAEIELLPKVAAIVGWPGGVEWRHDGWKFVTRHADTMTDGDMSARIARRIADWIDDDELDYWRATLRSGRGIEVCLHDRWIGRGATRLEAEMRAVLQWAESVPIWVCCECAG